MKDAGRRIKTVPARLRYGWYQRWLSRDQDAIAQSGRVGSKRNSSAVSLAYIIIVYGATQELGDVGGTEVRRDQSHIASRDSSAFFLLERAWSTQSPINTFTTLYIHGTATGIRSSMIAVPLLEDALPA